jgi:hypothetical protein
VCVHPSLSCIESESILREITAISHYFNYHKDKNALAKEKVCVRMQYVKILDGVTKVRKILFLTLRGLVSSNRSFAIHFYCNLPRRRQQNLTLMVGIAKRFSQIGNVRFAERHKNSKTES